MYLTYSLNDENQMAEWDDFVSQHPDGTPFHLSGWLKSIEATYKYKPLLFVSKSSSNNIEGIFPCFHVNSFFTGSRLVSLPFSDYGGPLFYNKPNENILLSKIIDKFLTTCNCIEIRSNMDNNSDFVAHQKFKLHVLSLDAEPEIVKKNFNKKTTLYSIRKAKREKVNIAEDNSLKGIEAFYKLNTLTRKKHGLPPQPFAFLKNLFIHLIAKGQASLLLAIHESTPIAAGLFIYFGDTVYYKYNASDPASLTQKKPNHLLTWHAIKRACQQGFQYFDFGRTAINNPSLSKYKEMWGAEAISLPYNFYPNIKGVTAADEDSFFFKMVNNICRNLPDVVLKQLGAQIYKHIG